MTSRVAGGRVSALQAELDARTRQVAEQRHFMEQVINSLPVGLYVIDREYRVRAWNQTRETGLQGIRTGEALGHTIFEILHRQSAESLRREFDAVFATGELRQFETQSTAGGVARTYRISKVPMRVAGAATPVTHVITIGEDVTEARRAEARAAHAEKLAALGQLAAGIVHELNNPLATIAACAESLTDAAASTATADASPAGPQTAARAAAHRAAAHHQEYLGVIESEVQRCKRIVAGLLDFARVRDAEKARVDPNQIVDQTLFLLKHHERFRQSTVTRDLSPGLAVRANVDRLIQVLMALLLNAANATRGGGGISVRTRCEPGLVLVEVIDGGVGIPRADLRRIFEPFFTTKPPGQGTGLGLSICDGIVADHGGRLEVESTVGAGSVFRLVLPEAT